MIPILRYFIISYFSFLKYFLQKLIDHVNSLEFESKRILSLDEVRQISEKFLRVSQDTMENFATDNLPKFNSKLPLYQRIIKSDHLMNSLRLNQLKTYIPATNYLLEDDQGNKCRVSITNLKAIAEKYLRNPHLVDYLIAESKNTHLGPSSSYSSILDGSVGPRLRGKLQFEVYTDETGLAPSGPLQKKHNKYVKVFLTVPNLPFQKRCRSEDMEEVLSANRKELDSLVMPAEEKLPLLFAKLKEQLQELMATGVEVLHRDKKVKIEVTLSTICGDNAAVYEALGCKRCFNNNAFVCRFCGAKGIVKPPKCGSCKRENCQECANEQYDIQDLTVDHPLLTSEIVQAQNLSLKEIGVWRPSIFGNLPGINHWNCAPPGKIDF